MNRRSFLYTSACTAASFRNAIALTHEQVPATPRPTTLADYQGSSDDVDKFMNGATAKQQIAFVVAANGKTVNEDIAGADLIILPNKNSDGKLNVKRKDSEVVGEKMGDDGILHIWKTKKTQTPPHNASLAGLPTITRFAGNKAMWWTGDVLSLNGVNVPLHFVTDLASIPSIFYTLLPPDGPYTFAAIVHDWLYWNQGGTKSEADSTLKAGMIAFNVPAWKVTAIYDAVSKFGQMAWDSNAKAKAAGAGRVLAITPPTALVTWEEWQKDPAHFVHS